MKKLLWVLGCVVLVAGLASCSDDDDSSDDETTETTAGVDDSVSADDAEELVDDIAGDIDIRASGLEAALDAEVEVIDESTVKLTFDEGSVDVDSIQACAVVSSILEDGEVGMVVYPDGQETCD